MLLRFGRSLCHQFKRKKPTFILFDFIYVAPTLSRDFRIKQPVIYHIFIVILEKILISVPDRELLLLLDYVVSKVSLKEKNNVAKQLKAAMFYRVIFCNHLSLRPSDPTNKCSFLGVGGRISTSEQMLLSNRGGFGCISLPTSTTLMLS